ncbi:MAG: hypothetical protein ABR562_08135 [Thermoplasmatota archaeon]|nr:hypothetical protein [Halobacteriales archaeon]
MPTSLARPTPANLDAEKFLAQLGLREAHLRVQGGRGLISSDPRDLWRLLARRDEVVARLARLGVRQVSIDLGPPAAEDPEAPIFF